MYCLFVWLFLIRMSSNNIMYRLGSKRLLFFAGCWTSKQHPYVCQEGTCPDCNIPTSVRKGPAQTATSQRLSGRDLPRLQHPNVCQEGTCPDCNIPTSVRKGPAQTATSQRLSGRDLSRLQHPNVCQEGTCPDCNIRMSVRKGPAQAATFQRL